MDPQHPGVPQGYYPEPPRAPVPPAAPVEPAPYQPAHATQPVADATAAYTTGFDPGSVGSAPGAGAVEPAGEFTGAAHAPPIQAGAPPGRARGSNALLWGLVVVLVALVAALTVMFVVRGGRAPTTTTTSPVTTTRPTTTTPTTVTTVPTTTAVPTTEAPTTAAPGAGTTTIAPDFAPAD